MSSSRPFVISSYSSKTALLLVLSRICYCPSALVVFFPRMTGIFLSDYWVGRESSSSTHSFCTSITLKDFFVSRITTCRIPALIISRRHMEQDVESGRISPVFGSLHAIYNVDPSISLRDAEIIQLASA